MRHRRTNDFSKIYLKKIFENILKKNLWNQKRLYL